MTTRTEWRAKWYRGVPAALGTVALLTASAAPAVPIVDLQPEQQAVQVNDTVTVDVVATTPETVGAYDLNLSFDDSVLDAGDVTFSDHLGVSTRDATTDPGALDASETSLELPSTLERTQPDAPFELFSVAFNATAAGRTELDGAGAVLDPLGQPIGSVTQPPGGANVDAASITVNDDAPDPVPGPAPIGLLAAGLIGVLLRRR